MAMDSISKSMDKDTKDTGNQTSNMDTAQSHSLIDLITKETFNMTKNMDLATTITLKSKKSFNKPIIKGNL